MVDAIRKSEFGELTALASRDIWKALKWTQEFGIPLACTYEGLLERDDIDAVYISLPLSLHEEWAIKAAEAGKHVFCEKPLSYSTSSVVRIIKAGLNNGVIINENLACFYHKQYEKVYDMIHEGKIGRLKAFNSSFYIPVLKSDDIRYNAKLKGGALYDMGIYPLAMSMEIFQESLINASVTVDVGFQLPVDIQGKAVLKFERNKTAMIDWGFYQDFYINRYTVFGTEGRIEVNRAYSINEDHIPDITYTDSKERTRKIKVSPMNQYVEIINQFTFDILAKVQRDRTGMINRAIGIDKMRNSCGK